MACPMAFGPRLDCGGGGRGAGTGCPYHWPVGCRLRRGRSGGDGLRAVGWFPPAIDGVQQTELKAVVQEFPAKVGLDLANWNWKVVRRFVQERFEVSLSRSSCLNYLHRLGFVLKRPKKRLLKADAAKRETFVAEYAALVAEAQQVGAKVFFVDEAHFRADADPQNWSQLQRIAIADRSRCRAVEIHAMNQRLSSKTVNPRINRPAMVAKYANPITITHRLALVPSACRRLTMPRIAAARTARIATWHASRTGYGSPLPCHASNGGRNSTGNHRWITCPATRNRNAMESVVTAPTIKTLLREVICITHRRHRYGTSRWRTR